MKNSIVLQLQSEILDPDCDVLNALRKAHVIAAKLKLLEFDEWIKNELDGYKNADEIPEYRFVRGTLRAWNPYRGWIPATINDSDLEDIICNKKLGDAISVLNDFCKGESDHISIQFPGDVLDELNKLFNAPINLHYELYVDIHRIKAIIERIKDCLLQWTIKLEESCIYGEGMSFSDNEKSAALTIPQTINNYFGNTNVVNAPTQAPIVVGDSNIVTFSYNTAEELINKINKSLEKEQLSEDNIETIRELLSEINDKIGKKKKMGIIKSAFVALKDFLISVGASITASVIQAHL
jgi:hypothetical protein